MIVVNLQPLKMKNHYSLRHTQQFLPIIVSFVKMFSLFIQLYMQCVCSHRTSRSIYQNLLCKTLLWVLLLYTSWLRLWTSARVVDVLQIPFRITKGTRLLQINHWQTHPYKRIGTFIQHVNISLEYLYGENSICIHKRHGSKDNNENSSVSSDVCNLFVELFWWQSISCVHVVKYIRRYLRK